MTDIEIARGVKPQNITDIAKKIGLDETNLILYGTNKAKIDNVKKQKNDKSHLILVTAINPTPFGEGKTTISIGLGDALNKIGKKTLIVLREPSLGPVFGIKGGATGGGRSQVIPMEDINLHFTGDFHAITSANNLLCAAIDNHLFSGNSLNIDPESIVFKRAMDMNDRVLRQIEIGLGEKNGIRRKDGFNITSASEIMAILCLSKDIEDLRKRIDNILIGYTFDKDPIYASRLNVTGSILVLLAEAIKPNLVQTLEHNPVIIHGGPFANIAHGCNSIIATKIGLSLSDYVVTEAGFGADLGAEKFFDIKCRTANLKPSSIVLVVTIKALKYNGGVIKEEISFKNIDAVKKGLCNLEAHLNNLSEFNSNIVVALNKYCDDTEDELNIVKNYVNSKNIPFAISEAYAKGSDGAVELAQKVIEECSKENNFKLLYDTNSPIKEKIETIAKTIYHASKVNYSEDAIKNIETINKIEKSCLPICVAKTQYSISDDPKKLGSPSNYEIHVTDVKLYNGAGFITVFLGNIMTMPGLSKTPAYEKINIENNIIEGIF